MVWSLLLSFQADDLVTPSRWVGLDNYYALTQDPHFGAGRPQHVGLHGACTSRSASCWDWGSRWH